MLVTGAAGTVGSVVAKRLAERGARVRAAARTRPAALDGMEAVAANAAVPYVDVTNLAMADGDATRYMAAAHAAVGKPALPVAANGPRFIIDGSRIRRELGYAPVDRWDELLGALASHHAQATNSA